MAIGFSALAVPWRKRALSEIIQLTDGVQELLFPGKKFFDFRCLVHSPSLCYTVRM
jgi:hypothetical protein